MASLSAPARPSTKLACVVCAGEDFRFLHERHELGFSGEPSVVARRYELCARCALVRKTPQPSATALRDYYARAWQFAEPRPLPCFESAARWIAAALHLHGVRALARGLDVGAKDSALLRALSAFGVPVAAQDAIDPQPQSPGVEPAWLGEGHYVHPTRCDFVAATHVLEHVHDPRLFLADLGGIVAEGGFLYLEVPALEIDGYGHADNINRAHLWHFAVPTLARLFGEHPRGFQLVRLDFDDSVPDWPVTRALLRRGTSDEHSSFAAAFQAQAAAQTAAVDRALARLERYDASDSVLYAACENLLQLWARAGREYWDERFGAFRIVDAYRREFLGREVWTPEAGLAERRFALIATRHWSSIRDIERWLAERFPQVTPVRLYE
jgi:SAM-dependent methyltransferase